MKAIVLWQPWASAIALGLKRNETRDWPAVCGGQRYRGWLAICAAKTTIDPQTRGSLQATLEYLLRQSKESGKVFANGGYFEKNQALSEIIGHDCVDLVFQRLPLGAIVAVAWLEECLDTNYCEINPSAERGKWKTPGWPVTDLEKLWGNYTPDRWAWRFTECWRLNTPIPVRGERKIFNVDLPANWQDQATKAF